MLGALQSGTVAASAQQFYTNYGFGARLGVDRLNYSKNVVSESILYFDVVSGRFSNFDVAPVTNRPWRFGFEGVFRVPATPITLGFSANIHQNFGLGNSMTVDPAKDDLRFFIGAKFDAGKLFDKLGTTKLTQ